ncbi:MAG: hypothetical protein IJ276_00040 [Alphaproteobacteria bacterium]|nr:hypothetical protein [Alphaproteobacteria bacterium]
MGKKLSYFGILFLSATAAGTAFAATRASQYIKPDTYNYMYPYMNNQMRVDLNPGITPSQSTNPMDVVVRTEQLSTERRVVPRARKSTTARAATNTSAKTSNNSNRRVVARRGKNTNANTIATVNRYRNDASYTNRTSANATGAAQLATQTWTSSRCLADYSACMDNYCERENTAYNRCYCSAKLSQIDSTYQPAIDKLIKQIISLKNTNTWTDAEMNEYWMEKIGNYVGDNSWVNLENALNIDWAGTESRVRGQYAFTTGHDYCMQHLQGCFYMASNLRDAYRSEIARDCGSYEQSLQRIKNAAESIVESYND